MTPALRLSLQNTFHTLKDMRIVMVDGTVLDTSDAARCELAAPQADTRRIRPYLAHASSELPRAGAFSPAGDTPSINLLLQPSVP